jgi:hypothetical protein
MRTYPKEAIKPTPVQPLGRLKPKTDHKAYLKAKSGSGVEQRENPVVLFTEMLKRLTEVTKKMKSPIRFPEAVVKFRGLYLLS